MHRTHLTTILLVLALLGVLPGCGDGDDPWPAHDTTAETTSTRRYDPIYASQRCVNLVESLCSYTIRCGNSSMQVSDCMTHFRRSFAEQGRPWPCQDATCIDEAYLRPCEDTFYSARCLYDADGKIIFPECFERDGNAMFCE